MRLVAAVFVPVLLSGGVATSRASEPAPAPRAAPAQSSGVAARDLDRSIRPQDDFYGFAVGGWIARVKGPAYMPGWSAGRELQLSVYEGLNRDLQKLAAHPDGDVNHRKLADLYASYMDEAEIEAAGLQPLAPYFARFDAITDPAGVVQAMGQLSAQNLDLGFGVWIHPDDEDPNRYLADFVQSDLGLPDRDYYLSDEPRFVTVRDAYRQYVEHLLTLTGATDAPALAKGIVDLETRMAAAQWTQTANRVPGATTHRQSRVELATATPGLDLALYADAIGISGSVARFNVGQPSYFVTLGQLLAETPLPVWRAYLKVRLIDNVSRFLPIAYREQREAFSRTLTGATASRPRWLRAVGFVEDTMGDSLGQLYVQRYFSAEAERRARTVLANVVEAFRQRIRTSNWLSETSKHGALAKLDNLVIRLGAPDKIRDYAALETHPDDPVGNWLRARALQIRFDLAKLTRPVDREEWSMTPQSVNGYYSVSRNQVVLPAALLQAPYFQADADDAVNYGGLGWFIAHELTHAFDRAGSQYDGFGKRVEWMTPVDRAEFERRVHSLIAQYGGYEAAPGFRLNGELSIGENIADVSGLAIAHDAYRLALAGRKAPMLDGWTGEQRFFLGFARVWASEPIKSQQDVTQALADTHSPDRYRVIGAVANQEAFYTAFGVKPGDPMFLPISRRTRIW
jgi:predicted metalloendopeptidase